MKGGKWHRRSLVFQDNYGVPIWPACSGNDVSWLILTHTHLLLFPLSFSTAPPQLAPRQSLFLLSSLNVVCARHSHQQGSTNLEAGISPCVPPSNDSESLWRTEYGLTDSQLCSVQPMPNRSCIWSLSHSISPSVSPVSDIDPYRSRAMQVKSVLKAFRTHVYNSP